MLNSLKSKRILFVDDEESLLSLYTYYFAPLCLKLDTALNGEEALLKIKNNFYDFIISDIRMPKLDGTGLFKAFSKISKGGQKFIFLSGLSDFSEEDLKELWAVDLLNKPLSLKSLRDHLLRASSRAPLELQL